MEPSENDYLDYRLPDGSFISFWVASDHRLSDWSYFWVGSATAGIPEAWYRVFRVDTTPPAWQPMKSVEDVCKQTGFENDDGGDTEARIGAAEKLPMGRFVVQLKVRVAGKEAEFPGIIFKVKGGPIPGGWG